MEIRHFVSTKGNEINKGIEGMNASTKVMGTNYKPSYNGTLICFIFREESKYAFKNAFIIKSQGAAPPPPRPLQTSARFKNPSTARSLPHSVFL